MFRRVSKQQYESVTSSLRTRIDDLMDEVRDLKQQLIEKEAEHNRELEYAILQKDRKIELQACDIARDSRTLTEVSFLAETITKVIAMKGTVACQQQ